MSRMDEGYRKMVRALNGKTDKVEPGIDPKWLARVEERIKDDAEFSDEEKYGGVAWPPTPGPANPSAYHCIAESMANTVVAKQEAYGDSFTRSGEVLKILYPAGIPREALPDALTVVRVVDKLFRVANKKDAFGESPWRDVVGYGLLAIKRDETKGAR